MTDKKKIIIIGGGAAGFFCAVNAARMSAQNTTGGSDSLEITILERTSDVLRKVRVSGGGRCNVTHACQDNSILVKNYPRGEKELKAAFSRFSVSDTVQWFEQRGVRLKTEEDGRMFPASNTSESIVQCLTEEALKFNVKIRLHADVLQISKTADASPEDRLFTIHLLNGETVTCSTLVVATGGRPKESGYNWLNAMGLVIEKPVPSLFTFTIKDQKLRSLMGLSVPQATVKITGTRLASTGPLLITHWGLSGPAVLKLSAWGARTLNELNYQFSIRLNWTSLEREEQVITGLNRLRTAYASARIFNSRPFDLPKRLWEFLLEKAGIDPELRWADLSKKRSAALTSILFNDEYQVSGKTTFKEEFVTCGGIKLNEIDFKTMESRKIAGLYFVGEVLDVDAVTGGFNFQNAWTTGWIAANAICQTGN